MESDVGRLLAKFESGALLRPSAAAANVVDLSRALWSAAGAQTTALSPAAEAIARRIGDPEHLVFVLVDGLGMDMLEAMPAATFLWSHLEGTLQTVFPSTTAVALTSLATGAWPAVHGIVGHWLQLDAVGSVTVLAGTTRPEGRALADFGVTSDDLFLATAAAPTPARERLSLLPAAIVDSPFSAFAAGPWRVGYRSINDAFELAADFIKAAVRPTFTYIYISRIDDTAHELGSARLELVGAVRDLDASLRRLASVIGGRGRVVLTADHGHLAVRPFARRVVRGGDLATAFRAPPTGDARVVSFHLQPGTEAEFATKFRDQVGAYFCLLTPDEIEALELLGPGALAPETKRRLGDLVAISVGDDILEFRARGMPSDRRLAWPSHHSGLTAAEMRVPLLIV